MMQLEQEQNSFLLQKAINLKQELSLIDTNKLFTACDLGSLVITNSGNYFLSIGLGKIEIDTKVYYAISLASPLVTALKGKRVGENCIHSENKTNIIEIY